MFDHDSNFGPDLDLGLDLGLDFPSDDSNLPEDASHAPSLLPEDLDHISEIETREPDDIISLPPMPLLPDGSRMPYLPPRHDTVPGLFSKRSINLLVGSSNAGKTALLLSQLETYLTPKSAPFNSLIATPPTYSFLLHTLPAGQLPYAAGAIVCTRTLESFRTHIASMGLTTLADPVKFPIRAWPAKLTKTMQQTLYQLHNELCEAARTPVHFLVIDGFQFMLESGKTQDLKTVRDFYYQINQFTLDRDCTILGTVNMAKMRKGEYYPLLGDRVYGSIVWAQEADTIIGIEQNFLSQPESLRLETRRIVIQTRHSNTQVFTGEFDEDGRLYLADEAGDEAANPNFVMLDAILDTAPADKTWTKRDWEQIGKDMEIGESVVERWLGSRCHKTIGMLIRLGSKRNRTYGKPSAAVN